MKNLFYLSILLFGLFLTSCSSDDDSSDEGGDIVGKWAWVNRQYNDLTIPYDDHEECGKDYLEFKSDGSYKQVDIWDCEEDIDETGTYSVSGNQLTITTEGENYQLTYSVNGNTLSFLTLDDIDDDGTREEVTFNLQRL